MGQPKQKQRQKAKAQKKQKQKQRQKAKAESGDQPSETEDGPLASLFGATAESGDQPSETEDGPLASLFGATAESCDQPLETKDKQPASLYGATGQPSVKTEQSSVETGQSSVETEQSSVETEKPSELSGIGQHAAQKKRKQKHGQKSKEAQKKRKQKRRQKTKAESGDQPSKTDDGPLASLLGATGQSSVKQDSQQLTQDSYLNCQGNGQLDESKKTSKETSKGDNKTKNQKSSKETKDANMNNLPLTSIAPTTIETTASKREQPQIENGQTDSLCLDNLVSTIDSQRVIVLAQAPEQCADQPLETKDKQPASLLGAIGQPSVKTEQSSVETGQSSVETEQSSVETEKPSELSGIGQHAGNNDFMNKCKALMTSF